MKPVVWTVLILLVIVIGSPLLNEETGSACSALERRTVTLLRGGGTPTAGGSFAGALLGGVQSLSDGAVARDEVRRRQPNLPAVVGCVWYYWDSLLDPEGFKGSLGG